MHSHNADMPLVSREVVTRKAPGQHHIPEIITTERYAPQAGDGLQLVKRTVTKTKGNRESSPYEETVTTEEYVRE